MFKSQYSFLDVNRDILEDLRKYPFYFINLEASDRRRCSMIGAYMKYGLKYTRIDAVNGKKYPLPCTLTQPTKLGRGELACTLSHIRAIKKAYDDGVEMAIIQEDDTSLELLPYWTMTMSQLIGEAPPDWQLIHLSSFYKFPQNEWKGTPIFQPWDFELNASTYLINRSGMARVLQSFNNQSGVELPPRGYSPDEPVDIFLYKMVKTYIPNAILFVPYESGSDIGHIYTMEKPDKATEWAIDQYKKGGLFRP